MKYSIFISLKSLVAITCTKAHSLTRDEHSNSPDCDKKEAAAYVQIMTAQAARKHGDSASHDFRGRAHPPGLVQSSKFH